jgi:hypothetical protein
MCAGETVEFELTQDFSDPRATAADGKSYPYALVHVQVLVQIEPGSWLTTRSAR